MNLTTNNTTALRKEKAAEDAAFSYVKKTTMKITNKQLNYIRYLRKIRQYGLKHELDYELTQIQASYLIKKLLKLNK